MKCELCHQADATCAITRERDGVEEELYVCKACAKAERRRLQANSQRTRKIPGLPPGVSMSVTEISASGDPNGDEPPAILQAIANAFEGMVTDLKKVRAERSEKKAKMQEFPTERVEPAYRIKNMLHLEGLHMIGELDAVMRALHALNMDLVGVMSDGIRESAHAYRLAYMGSSERAKRVVQDLLREEKNARARLRGEMPRVFSDSICRALALLKNCRLLSPGEFFDLLSPLRLAAMEKLLDGVTRAEIDRMMSRVDLSGYEEKFSQDERDLVDGERADRMNKRFEEVMLNDVL